MVINEGVDAFNSSNSDCSSGSCSNKLILMRLFLINYRFYCNGSFTGNCVVDALHNLSLIINMLLLNKEKCLNH